MRANKAGFTLIEVLLAVTLFSLVAVVLYSLFAGAIMVARQAQQAEQYQQDVYWPSRLLSIDLENMIFFQQRGSAGKLESLFEGAENKIALVIPTEKGLFFVKYYLASSIDEGKVIGWDLIREETKMLMAQSEEIANKEIIARGLTENGLRFFYGIQAIDTTWQWQTKWEQTGLPSHLKVEIDFLNDGDKEELQTLKLDIFNPTGLTVAAGSETSVEQ